MHRALLAAAGAQGKTYVEDVFSAYPYAGNGSTQTITNGIDLTKGGLVWIKDRSSASFSNYLSDTVRGAFSQSDNTTSESPSSIILSGFNSNGFALKAIAGVNGSSDNYASWTFRRAPKFFDVVTWTGDGTSNRQIPHALGITPGMVTVKRRDAAGSWITRHRSATGELYLEQTTAQATSFTQITATSAMTFSVSGNANILNATYVAYAWAHDPDTVNGIVQCGSCASNATVNLGWEPQFILTKNVTTGVEWKLEDTSRGLSSAAPNSKYLVPNSSAAEVGGGYVAVNSSGFTASYSAGDTIIYLAIRRGPMRTPTSGASVYNAIARTGTGAAATVTGVGFAPDAAFIHGRNAGRDTAMYDRLRGATLYLMSSVSNAEATGLDTLVSFGQDGVSFGADSTGFTNIGTVPFINWFFRRAPGFFDIVCYNGTGANQTLSHNLGVAPGMIWFKDRGVSNTNAWNVYHSTLGAGQSLALNTNTPATADTTLLNNTAPTLSGFTVGTKSNTNNNGDNFVAYLFGALPGVSAIGGYGGTGGAKTINCGFASGARFVLIKRTDTTGDWIVLDTARGIVSGNDPYLLLDSTAAEVTTADLLTPQSIGFGLTSNALVNANGGNFIYFAVA
ncbi:hypothetical protein BCh11DRAFT_00250 [Burkholderia sp. Ch1-1]|nr:hypothetical protein BCh11DRAFT_00250 [Burkholderia sp. Ch1-1]